MNASSNSLALTPRTADDDIPTALPMACLRVILPYPQGKARPGSPVHLVFLCEGDREPVKVVTHVPGLSVTYVPGRSHERKSPRFRGLNIVYPLRL